MIDNTSYEEVSKHIKSLTNKELLEILDGNKNLMIYKDAKHEIVLFKTNSKVYKVTYTFGDIPEEEMFKKIINFQLNKCGKKLGLS